MLLKSLFIESYLGLKKLKLYFYFTSEWTTFVVW